MNISLNRSYFPWQSSGSKSEQDRLQRQVQRDSQVAFLENQKKNLKNMTCGSLEEISRKLEMLQSYDDQITAAEEEFNNSQMLHIMDEAKERGEKIAEAAEKHAPKTAEERKKEMVEEVLGTEEEKGLLTEVLEEVAELAEEMSEETLDEGLKAAEEASGGLAESTEEVSVDAASTEASSVMRNRAKTEPQAKSYKSVDYYI